MYDSEFESLVPIENTLNSSVLYLMSTDGVELRICELIPDGSSALAVVYWSASILPEWFFGTSDGVFSFVFGYVCPLAVQVTIGLIFVFWQCKSQLTEDRPSASRNWPVSSLNNVTACGNCALFTQHSCYINKFTMLHQIIKATTIK